MEDSNKKLTSNRHGANAAKMSEFKNYTQTLILLHLLQNSRITSYLKHLER